MKKQIVNMDEMITPHFTMKEMTQSATALDLNIDNTPNSEQAENLRQLCRHVLEPLRQRFGVIRITSGFRCEQLNKAVHGAPNSQHLRGEAADIHLSNTEVGEKMFNYIKNNIPFDQLLFEHPMHNGCFWLHVSYVNNRRPNRKQALRIN